MSGANLYGLAVLACLTVACSSTTSSGSADGGAGDSSAALSIYCEKGVLGSDACTCINDPNRTTQIATCSSTSPANSFCCADMDYPQTGVCQCEPWGCAGNGTTCNCGVQSNVQAPDSSCSRATLCCAHPLAGSDMVISCHCDSLNTTCTGGDTLVASCEVSAARCDSNRVLVTSCTR
jgi:hypothetical protein